MQQRNRNTSRSNKAPLLVMEIILPDPEKPGSSHTCLKNYSMVTSYTKSGEEITENASCSVLTIGSHEVKPITGLVSLEKKVQEDYFRGTREKKHSKKKGKHKKANHSINETLFKESQSKFEGLKISKPTEGSLSLEDIIQRRNFQQEILKYEKMKEYSNTIIHIKQRQAEKKYIQEQESLIETWLERKNQLKQDCLSSSKATHSKTFHSNEITNSITPQKFWNDGKDESSQRKRNSVSLNKNKHLMILERNYWKS